MIDRDLQRLEEAGNPIRVGLAGAGYIGVPAAVQLMRYVPGIRVAAIASRKLKDAGRAYHLAGRDELAIAETQQGVDQAIFAGKPVITENASLLAQADGVDVVLDLTANINAGAELAVTAFSHGKHIVGYNAELCATVGSVLKRKADQAGLVYTEADGDQPGVLMNLYRHICGMGMRPVLCGNIKGLEDHYRTPDTQRSFAAKWGQKAHMVTSFADGTKISFEQAVIANATNLRVAKRGMLGLQVKPGTPVEEAVRQINMGLLMEGPGIVDYIIGAAPAPGVFILAISEDPLHQQYMRYFKMGEGPLYCFVRPYHLCHLEIANSIARAALYGDATITPQQKLSVEVIATAKRDLLPGETLDGIGRFTLYGQCENADVVQREGLLPMGLAEGAVLNRKVAKDEVLCIADVKMPPQRMIDQLWEEQDFPG